MWITLYIIIREDFIYTITEHRCTDLKCYRWQKAKIVCLHYIPFFIDAICFTGSVTNSVFYHLYYCCIICLYFMG